MMVKIQSIFVFFFSLILAASVQASTLSSLIRYALKHSPEIQESQATVNAAAHSKSFAQRSQFLPKISINLSRQNLDYDQLYDQNGTLISNDGTDPLIGVGVSYNLQNLLGPSSRIAGAALNFAKIKSRIQKRALIKDIKDGFFAVREASSELTLLQNQIGLFNRIDSILKRQRQLGVFNDIQREQFGIQKGLLIAKVSSQNNRLASLYSKLAVVVGMKASQIKSTIAQINEDPPFVFADKNRLHAKILESLSQSDVLRGLKENYDLANLKYHHFTPVPLPSVYASVRRDWPTMPSHAGPKTVTEVGLTLPIDSIFTRPQEKEKLAAQKDEQAAAYSMALAQYHSAVRLSILKIQSLKSEAQNLKRVHKQAEKLLRKSFLYYSQKRLDAMGTLDIFQKSFEASRALLTNNLNTRIADANLEYLVGDPRQ